MASKSITNDTIYKLINDVRLELKSDIGGLRSDFTTLEAGRLTALESHYTDLRLQVNGIAKDATSAEKTLSNKFIVMGAIGMATLSAILYGVVQFIVGRAIKVK